jgi:hypothetical protein
MDSAMAPIAPVIKIDFPERSMLIISLVLQQTVKP